MDKVEKKGKNVNGVIYRDSDGKLKLNGVFGADTPADWDDVEDDDVWESVPRDTKPYVDPKFEAEVKRIELLLANMPEESVVQTGYGNGIGSDKISGGDVYVPKKTDINDILEIASHFGEFGSGICDLQGRLYENAAQICKAWGVYGWEKVKDSNKSSMEFMMDLRNWFIEKYMPMLNACATPTWYAEFKGVSYEVIAARINYQMRKKIRDNDDMEVEYWGGSGGTRKTRKRRDKLDFVVISGVRFILVPLEELEEWYMFLARKGVGKLVTDARFGEARYLGNMLVEAGKVEKEELEMLMADSDTVKMWIEHEGMCVTGEARAVNDPRKWGGDDRKQWYSDEGWEEYERWCRKRGFNAVSYGVFGRRIKAMGFKRFAKEGRRGFYWYESAAEKK